MQGINAPLLHLITFFCQHPKAKEYAEGIFQKRKGIEEDKLLFTSTARYQSTKTFAALEKALEDGEKPSTFFEQKASWLFGTFILPRFKEAFFWAVDACREWPYSMGWARRPLRSPSYGDYAAKINSIVWHFSNCMVDADLCGLLTGQVPEDAADFLKEHKSYCPELIAYELNRGNPRLEELLSAALNTDGDAPTLTHDMIAGIMMSRHAGMVDHLVRLLLAAQLQEGLRQSICERADEGTVENYLRLLHVIDDNNLIRFSSVKRAVGVWTGILADDATDLERVTKKELELLIAALEQPERREAMSHSEDPIALTISLWALGVINVYDAVKRAEDLAETGSRHQTLTCGYFASMLSNWRLAHRMGKCALKKYPDDQEILAVYLFDFARGGGESRRYSLFFDTPQEGRDYYALLKNHFSRMKEKEKRFSPCIFPWYEATLKRCDIAEKLCDLAELMGEEAYLDDAILLIPSVDSFRRIYVMEALLSKPQRESQYRAIMNCLADKSQYAREKAYEIAKALPVDKLDIPSIENHLRLKAADIHTGCIGLLYQQMNDSLFASVERLMQDGNEGKRSAAYDLIVKIAGDEKRASLWGSCRELLSCREPGDEKEKLLWQTAVTAVSPGKEESTDALYTEADEYIPDITFLKEPKYREAFLAYFPDTQLFSPEEEKKSLNAILKQGVNPLLDKTRACASCLQAREDLQSLADWIARHENDSIGVNPCTREEELLGSGRLWSAEIYELNNMPFPCADLWEEWYQDMEGPKALLPAAVLALSTKYDANGNAAVDLLFGPGFSQATEPRYISAILSVLSFLIKEHGNREEMHLAGMAVADWFLSAPESQIVYRENNAWHCAASHPAVSMVLEGICQRDIGEEDQAFAVRAAMQKRFESAYVSKVMMEQKGGHAAIALYHQRYSIEPALVTPMLPGKAQVIRPGILDYLSACLRGQITRRTVYYYLFQHLNMRSALEELSSLSLFYRASQGETGLNLRRSRSRFMQGNAARKTVERLLGRQEGFSPEQLSLLSLADQVYSDILPLILHAEINRGELETPYTDAVTSIQYLCGAEWLGVILAALGKEKLERSELYYWRTLSRKASLSHLLGVSAPGPEDSLETLQKVIRQYGIQEQRLIETAMYNPAWAELIGRHMGWEGFVSAVFYFIAHMKADLDESRMAVIARYTPLSAEALNDGAFDLTWFQSAYGALGEERFFLLYDAAKYISDGAKHSRARKYADAALGRMDLPEVERQIQEKRNKDLLMAYPLIPLKGEEDALRRFLFIQRFLKESRKYGAQRSASEKRACEMALENLAQHTGDRDVTRLTLRMENRLAENRQLLFQPKAVEDISVRLAADPKAGVALICEKGGKELKAVPGRLKKHETILTLSEAKKELTEQFRRTRRFLEEAMETGVSFTVRELTALRENPVIQGMMETLVYRSENRFFLLTVNGFCDLEGEMVPLAEKAELTLAHPYQLYTAGVWPAWQRLLFERQITQPFKQVFRELYIKTADEQEALVSQRYAGYQVQPRKAAAALKARRWLAAPEAGLQKIYYQENIVANMFAQADWFSPSDIEAPAIEWVAFSDRRTGEQIPLKHVPEVIFSEVMRDVDLAVSVAYVGGVDPEASHATVEMRGALLAFTLRLFKLSNVEIANRHALIRGTLARYSVHLGSGVAHQQGGPMLQILPVHSQHRGKLFLPFADDDPKTAEIISKVLLLAQDQKIKDPSILEQIVKE